MNLQLAEIPIIDNVECGKYNNRPESGVRIFLL